MKRLLLSMLLLPVIAGCVDLAFSHRENSSHSVTPVSAITTPIIADQVTPANARRMAEELQNEIDRDDLPPPAAEKRKSAPIR